MDRNGKVLPRTRIAPSVDLRDMPSYIRSVRHDLLAQETRSIGQPLGSSFLGPSLIYDPLARIFAAPDR